MSFGLGGVVVWNLHSGFYCVFLVGSLLAGGLFVNTFVVGTVLGGVQWCVCGYVGFRVHCSLVGQFFSGG